MKLNWMSRFQIVNLPYFQIDLLKKIELNIQCGIIFYIDDKLPNRTIKFESPSYMAKWIRRKRWKRWERWKVTEQIKNFFQQKIINSLKRKACKK